MKVDSPKAIKFDMAAADATYGFIGLGNMGMGMAKNVREKIPATSKMLVCELVRAQRDEFCSTTEGLIEAVDTPKAIAEQCVCTYDFGREF